MARPPRSDTGEVADKVIPVRMTESEHAEVKAKQGNLSQSAFMRRAALDDDIPQQRARPPVPAVNRQLYLELGQIGENLKQQADACHEALQQGQTLPLSPKTISAVADKVDQVRLALLGIDPDEDDGDKDEVDDW